MHVVKATAATRIRPYPGALADRNRITLARGLLDHDISCLVGLLLLSPSEGVKHRDVSGPGADSR